jgi:hypothetical protein
MTLYLTKGPTVSCKIDRTSNIRHCIFFASTPRLPNPFFFVAKHVKGKHGTVYI